MRPDQRKRVVRPLNKTCPFCDAKLTPDYKDPRMMKSYMTEKGKLLSRLRSGLCLTHQRALTIGVKKARFMSLLPYVSMTH